MFFLIWVLSSDYERGYNLPSVKCSINEQDEVKTKKTKQNKSAYVFDILQIKSNSWTWFIVVIRCDYSETAEDGRCNEL